MSAPARRPRRTAALLAAGLLALVALSGCGGTTYHLRGRSELVNGLAARLDQHQRTSYTAWYRFGDGDTATVTYLGGPQRIAYVFRAAGKRVTGRYVRTSQNIITCTSTICTLTSRDPLRARAEQIDLRAVDAASAHRFVPAERVLSLLTDAAADSDATIDHERRTIADQRSYCVSVHGGHTTSPFEACLTGTGALASFVGTVGGHRVDVTLTGYRGKALGHPFGPSRGARIDDRRSPTEDG